MNMKTRTLAILWWGLAVALLSGCGYTYHFRDNSAQRGEEHNELASYFLFGIIGDHEVNVREFCPQGAYEITTGTNFLTWFISGITLGIYTPRKVNIWCSRAGAQPVGFQIDFGEDGTPARVTRRVAQITSVGAVQRVDGRYGVIFREGEDR